MFNSTNRQFTGIITEQHIVQNDIRLALLMFEKLVLVNSSVLSPFQIEAVSNQNWARNRSPIATTDINLNLPEHILMDIDYLEQQDILTRFSILDSQTESDPAWKKKVSEFSQKDSWINDKILDKLYSGAGWQEYYFDYRKSFLSYWLNQELPEFLARLVARNLRIKSHINAEAIGKPIDDTDEPKSHESVSENSALSLMLDNIKIPDQNIPLEEILDFRESEIGKIQFLRFRNWLQQMEEINNPVKMLDEFRYLKTEYEFALKKHKLRTRRGRISSIVSAAISGLAGKPDFLRILNEIFLFGKQEIDYIDDELNFSGKEVAYLVRLSSTFGNDTDETIKSE